MTGLHLLFNLNDDDFYLQPIDNDNPADSHDVFNTQQDRPAQHHSANRTVCTCTPAHNHDVFSSTLPSVSPLVTPRQSERLQSSTVSSGFFLPLGQEILVWPERFQWNGRDQHLLCGLTIRRSSVCIHEALREPYRVSGSKSPPDHLNLTDGRTGQERKEEEHRRGEGTRKSVWHIEKHHRADPECLATCRHRRDEPGAWSVKCETSVCGGAAFPSSSFRVLLASHLLLWSGAAVSLPPW